MNAEEDGRQPSRRRIRTLDLLRLLFSALSIGLVVMGLYALRENSRVRGWATVEGRIAASGVAQFSGKDGVTYQPNVTYAYSVGGVLFRSNRIAFSRRTTGSRSAADKVVARYPVGRVVQVTYDPADPEHAVLERRASGWMWIVAGGVFAMLTVWTRIQRGRLERNANR